MNDLRIFNDKSTKESPLTYKCCHQEGVFQEQEKQTWISLSEILLN